MLMLTDIITTESLLGLVLAGQAASLGLFWRLWNKVHADFVPRKECALIDAATREKLQMTRDQVEQACTVATERDSETQKRIEDVKREIAASAAEAILRSERVQAGIAELLARK